VSPYFGFEKVEYAIEDENSVHEGIKLVFKNEKIVIVLNKEGILFLFEGDADELKNQNGPIKFFWDIYEKIKGFKNYIRTTRHILLTHAVNVKAKEEVVTILKTTPYFAKNLFGNLDEFGCSYEFLNDGINFKIQFGNFTPKDIRKHDLSPFKTEFNKDLFESVGIMGRIELFEQERNPTFSKFKNLLTKTEENFLILDLIAKE